MKKAISLLLSTIIALSTLSISFPVIAKEIEQNNAIIIGEKVAALSERYDEDEIEVVETETFDINPDKDKNVPLVAGEPKSPEIENTNRLIVKTAKNVETYGAEETVTGLGYTFLQYENHQDAQNAYDELVDSGYTVSYDSIISTDVSSSKTLQLVDTSIPEREKTDMWAYEKVEAPKAIELLKGKKLDEVTVGVIDTGVDYTHEVFEGRITDTDLNFSSSGKENDCMDDYGHGTSVASIIAMSTPDNVKIKPYKLLNSNGNYTISEFCCLMEYIINENNKPDVINMSFGYRVAIEDRDIYIDLLNELNNLGITLVVAGGNDAAGVQLTYPACVESCMAVSASTPYDRRASFSNVGEEMDFAAPGVDVYVATLGGGYKSNFNGTSGSTPFVSAAAAIVLCQDSSKTPEEVKQSLAEGAVDVQTKSLNVWCGTGIINFVGIIEGERTPDVKFSYSGGDYYDDTLILELSCDDPNAVIKYTFNNSVPNDEYCFTYTEPIEITEEAEIIAVAYSDDKLPSRFSREEYRIIYNESEENFTVSSKGELTGYNGTHTNIIVPNEINDIKLVAVGKEAFRDNNQIKYIELPESVTEIKDHAFRESELREIVAVGVDYIGQYSFYNVNHFWKETMPNVKELYLRTFASCYILKSVDFNEVVEDTGRLAFDQCALTQGYFPNAICADGLFSSTLITEAYLPKITELDRTFYYCPLLENFYCPLVDTIYDNTFNGCELITEYDMSKIETVYEEGLRGSYFENIDLPNCSFIGMNAFRDATTEYINIPLIKEIYPGTFVNCINLQSINMPNVKEFIYEYDGFETRNFSNCFSLKSLYLPNAINFPSFGVSNTWDSYQKLVNRENVFALKTIYIPKVKEITENRSGAYEDNNHSGKFYEDYIEHYLNNVELLFAPSLVNAPHLPNSENMVVFLSENFTTLGGGVLPDPTDLNYTVVAPRDSYGEQLAKENGYTFIPSDSRDDSIENPANVTDLGRSICTTVAGLRFGFTWDNIDEIESLASDIEYGFVYSQKGVEGLSLDKVDGVNVKSVTATNRIDHGDTTSFNLVISNIPKSYYDREITARAYVCIDGMYFYSNEQKGSFGEVANLVLADNEIDTNTKNAVKNLLEKEA